MVLKIFGVNSLGQKLSNRECKIASLLALGFTKKEIGAKIYKSENTIVNQARVIYTKLGIRNVQELTLWWLSAKYNLTLNIKELRQEALASAMLVVVLFSIVNYEEFLFISRRQGARRYYRTEIKMCKN